MNTLERLKMREKTLLVRMKVKTPKMKEMTVLKILNPIMM